MTLAQLKAPPRPDLRLVRPAMVSTKFRTPASRRGTIERTGLLTRLRGFATDKRVTVICAPAGSGKTTLLGQLAAHCEPAELVWLSLDEEDSDANQLFASLATALTPVALEWEVAPAVLPPQVLGTGEHSRKAVNLLVDALSSYQGERLLIVLDNLQRVSDPAAIQLFNELIEKLPPEVSVLIGTRVAPELSLARWRSRGELGELALADLKFDERDAHVLARARLGNAAHPELVRQALDRSQGWVAGLQLLLGAEARADHPTRSGAERHTFDFLAQEVLADLPRDLRLFAERCSILPELSPALCNAVMGGTEAARHLEELYRRDLFITVVDQVAPVLSFHDLFREFLQRELERHLPPEAVRELHARAGQAAGTVSPRALNPAARQLSEREHEVLERIAAGDSNKLIARTLQLSPHTVKRHVANILEKLNVPTRGAAAAMLGQRGINF